MDDYYESPVELGYTNNYGVFIKAPYHPSICGLGTFENITGAQTHVIDIDTDHVYHAQYAVNTTGNFNIQVGYGHRILAVGGVDVSVTYGAPSIGISFNFGTDTYLSRPLLVPVADYK